MNFVFLKIWLFNTTTPIVLSLDTHQIGLDPSPKNDIVLFYIKLKKLNVEGIKINTSKKMECPGNKTKNIVSCSITVKFESSFTVSHKWKSKGN